MISAMTSEFSVKDILCMWPVCESVDKRRIPDKIQLAVVIGRKADNAIFVNENDEMYSFGSNEDGVLGIGDARKRHAPIEIKQLLRRGTRDIAAGYHHVLALTADGDVFAWGYNVNGELGDGTQVQATSPQLCRGMQRYRVKKIACGYHHSLALTDTHEVLGWGSNARGQVGAGTALEVTTPALVQGLPSSPPVQVIRCRKRSSFALTAGGEIHAWGDNDWGQLGIGRKGRQARPGRVSAELDVKFKDVACGRSHSLALTDEGHVYAWGKNGYGEIGVGNTESVLTPERVHFGDKRIKEIGASILSRFSAALSSCGTVMVWGHTKIGNMELPKATHLVGLHEAFRNLCIPGVTYRPLTQYCQIKRSDEESGSKFISSFKRHLDNEEVSDVKFLVGGKAIHGHVSVLRIRSPYFKTMLGPNWEEGNREIEVKGHSYATFKSYFTFLYTGKLEVQDENALSLLRLANEYLDDDLKQLCAERLAHTISINNVLEIYTEAKRMSVENLERSSFEFLIDNLTAVTETEAFDQLDPQVTKDLLRDAARFTAFRASQRRELG